MKPRKSEAARLESDYLRRVRESLGNQDAFEVEEILESLSAHIEEELVDSQDEEVTLVTMAKVLERLGPPEDYSQDEPAAAAGRTAGSPPPPLADAGQTSPSERRKFAEVLDKIWVAYLISVIGLYIPVIDLYFCDIIAGIILAILFLNLPAEKSRGLHALGPVVIAEVVIACLACGTTILTLASPFFAFLTLPLALGGIVCTLFIYWRVMGTTAAAVEEAGKVDVSRMVYSARTAYFIYTAVMLALGTIIGVVAALAFGAKNSADLWWLGYLLLPIHWVFGSLLVLRPIGRARDALRQ